MKWISTNFPGVRYREHPTRKHGVKKDKYFSIYYRVDSKRHEEGLGWSSQGWTEQKANERLSELKYNQRIGDGPQTLSEKRKEDKKKKEQDKILEEKEKKESITFSAVWENYYYPQAKIDKKSHIREEQLYRLYIKAIIGDIRMIDISPFYIEKIKKKMIEVNQSSRSIHYCLAIIRQVFNYALKHSLYEGENVASKVKKPVSDNRRTRFLSVEEAEKLLEALKNRSIETYQITLLSLHTGMRFGEIAKLTWGDIDIPNEIITISDPKNARNRAAFLTERLKKMFLEMEAGDKHELVFKGRIGQRKAVSETLFNRVVKKLGFNEGVIDPRQKVVFHTCRHTYASWLVTNGTDLYTVKELLGHRDITMTQRYSHLKPDTLKKAVKNFERAIIEEHKENGLKE
ncbi:MAG: site-specific integrase [Desulfobacterales bacterium]|nr:site-specific integrase [Desulfobacterales bacterium]